MTADADQGDDGAAEDSVSGPDRGAAIAAWKKRDRAAELAELAGDADAVAAMRKQLARLGVKAALNPFAIGTPHPPGRHQRPQPRDSIVAFDTQNSIRKQLRE